MTTLREGLAVAITALEKLTHSGDVVSRHGVEKDIELASRVLWVEFWQCFLIDPLSARELRKRIEDAYNQACLAIGNVTPTSDTVESRRIIDYRDSVRFRRTLLGLTFTAGKQRVLDLIDERRRDMQVTRISGCG